MSTMTPVQYPEGAYTYGTEVRVKAETVRHIAEMSGVVMQSTPVSGGNVRYEVSISADDYSRIFRPVSEAQWVRLYHDELELVN